MKKHISEKEYVPIIIGVVLIAGIIFINVIGGIGFFIYGAISKNAKSEITAVEEDNENDTYTVETCDADFSANTIKDRFPTPEGYVREDIAGFAEFMREYPLEDYSENKNKWATLDIPENSDLCGYERKSVMYLLAEYFNGLNTKYADVFSSCISLHGDQYGYYDDPVRITTADFPAIGDFFIHSCENDRISSPVAKSMMIADVAVSKENPEDYAFLLVYGNVHDGIQVVDNPKHRDNPWFFTKEINEYYGLIQNEIFAPHLQELCRHKTINEELEYESQKRIKQEGLKEFYTFYCKTPECTVEVAHSDTYCTAHNHYKGIGPSKKSSNSSSKKSSTSSSKKKSSKDSYDDGYEDVWLNGDYDDDRYRRDWDYALGVDDAMEEFDW